MPSIIDLLIALPIIKDMFPSLSFLLLGVVIACFLLLLNLPFYMLALFNLATRRIDGDVVRRFGNSEDLKTVIGKAAELRVPPSTFSARQLERYNRRRKKDMARRMSAIERASSEKSNTS